MASIKLKFRPSSVKGKKGVLSYQIIVYIQFGGHAVSRIHAHSFQPGQLLQEAAVFPEVHHTVQFHVVAASAEHAMPVDYLFAADKVFGTAQVDESVQ